MTEPKKTKPGKVILLLLEVIIIVVIVGWAVLKDTHYLAWSGKKPDVVVVMVDTMRADHLGCYGHDMPTSPFIDSMSSKGVTYENCRSQFPWTKPSIASFVTSLYPSAHRVISYPRNNKGAVDPKLGRGDILPTQMVTLAEAFKEGGYRTAGFITNRWLDPLFGFDQGYDDYFMLSQTVDANGGITLIPNQPASLVNRKVLDYLNDFKGGALQKALDKIGAHRNPLFLYIHYMDVHGPYTPPPRFAAMFDSLYKQKEDRKLSEADIEALHGLYLGTNSLNLHLSRYDAQIRYFDTELEKLITSINKNGLLDSPLWVLTSDHGEAFGEHGYFDHGGSLYEEEIRVPLIIWGSGVQKSTTIKTPVELIDVAPTILGLAGIEPSPNFTGRDINLHDRGAPLENKPVWSELHFGGKAEIIQADAGNKWSYDLKDRSITEHYNLAQDPGEKNNLVTSDPEELLQKTGKAMKHWEETERNRIKLESEAPSAILSEEVRRELEALGYLSP